MPNQHLAEALRDCGKLVSDGSCNNQNQGTGLEVRTARVSIVAAVALVSASQVGAAPLYIGEVVCGAPHTAAESLFLHQQRILRQPSPAQVGEEVTGGSYDDGDIAVIEASQHTVMPPNPVDLSNQSVTIVSGEDGFTVSAATLMFDVAASQRGLPLALEDDDFVAVELPFSFPYFGESYERAFVHSDGNLTFIHPEPSSTERNFSRAVGGPPRIAPLFRDLDPSRGGTMRFELLADSVVVTWYQVPVFVDEGTGAVQTFQVELGSDGKIEFRYGSLDADGAVVGIMPGDASKLADVVDWSASMTSSFAGDHILAEIFSSESMMDEFAVAQAFYGTHDDAYDQLIIINDMGLDPSAASLAHAYAVRNEIEGIGERVVDFGSFLGSHRRLSGFVNMGPLDDYPGDPYALFSGVPHLSMLSVLAHELGHRHLAYAWFTDPATDSFSTAILGRQLAHWSFFFHTSASVLEGNAIRDNGAEVDPRFETYAAGQTFSDLDQYLMGLLPPGEVRAMFLVVDPSGSSNLGAPSRPPEVGVSFNGTRKEVLVEHIIEAMGERRPDTSVSQRDFRHAFALLVEDASAPSAATLAFVNKLRTGWLTFSRSQLGSKARMTAGLVKMLHLSTWPAGGLISGATGKARVEIAEARDTDLTVTLTLDEAIATVPATVTIPAGAVHVDFDITGLEEGVTSLTARSAESGYDEPVTRLNVRAEVPGLVLKPWHPEELYGVAGEEIPARLGYLVRDENLVPYSGVEVAFQASGPSDTTIASSTTDANGQAFADWRLGTLPGDYELTASLEGDPDETVITRVEAASSEPTLDTTMAVNAASQESPAQGHGFAPGSLVTIGGAGLALEAMSADTLLASGNTSLPYELGGTQVTIGGLPVPLLRAEPTQVTFQVPFEIQGPTMQVIVTTQYGRTEVLTMTVSATQPGIFADRVSAGSTGTVLGAAPGTSALPQPGGVLEVYGTGLGAVDPVGRTGFGGQLIPVQSVVETTRAWIDDQEAEVKASKLAVLEAGVYVVLIELPDSLASGEHTVKIEVGGRESNEVTFDSGGQMTGSAAELGSFKSSSSAADQPMHEVPPDSTGRPGAPHSQRAE